MIKPIIRIGTRKSPLAMAQTLDVAKKLKQAHQELLQDGAIEIVKIETSGDKIQDRHLLEAGGKGLFTREIDEAMIKGLIDIGVNSMKDVPTNLAEGQILPCMLAREAVEDVFISPYAKILEKIPPRSKIGTASLRRQALLKSIRPDLEVTLLRGNVQTRLKKIQQGEADGTFLALAGLNRLKLSKEIAFTKLKTDEWLPAPGQGAVGITARKKDDRILDYLAPLHHIPTYQAVLAERGFLKGLDGSCKTPIAALASIDGDALHLRGWLARPDGSMIIKRETKGHAAHAEQLGVDLALSIKTMIGSLEQFLDG